MRFSGKGGVMLRRQRREVVFEARVESAEKGARLTPSGENGSVEDTVIRTLTAELPGEMRRLFGVEVEIHIKGTRYGSLSVFFGAVLTAYGLLSGYKGFSESMNLIRQQADDLLTGALRRLGSYSVNVYERYPGTEELDDWSPRYRWLRRRYPPDLVGEILARAEPTYEVVPPRRDGFFYFLLTLCIVEMAAMGLLVWRAVVHTYLR
jgi:hypothetical protein